MNTFQLSCFLSVADNLSFARAAEELHVTQPAITMQIKSLEKELGVKLFKLTTRTVKLTPEGFIFQNDAKRIIDLSNKAVQQFADPKINLIQTFNLGVTSHLVLRHLSPLLNDLKKRVASSHPLISVNAFRRLYRDLESDDLDALLCFKESAPKNDYLTYEEIAKAEISLVISKENPLSQKEDLSLEDLQNEKVVIYDPSHIMLDVTHTHSEFLDTRRVNDIFICPSEETILTLVIAGYGFSILPDIFIRDNHKIVFKKIKGLKALSYGIYYKKTSPNTSLKEFLKIIRDFDHSKS